MSAPATSESKFIELCRRILDSLSSMIKDARDAKLSDCDPSRIDTTKGLLSLAKPSDLIIQFIKMREHWTKIEEKDLNFLLKDMPVLFSQSGIDPIALCEPVRVYLLLKEQPASKTEPCINDEDITTLWNRFRLLVKLACRYNLDNGNKIDLKKYEDKFL